MWIDVTPPVTGGKILSCPLISAVSPSPITNTAGSGAPKPSALGKRLPERGVQRPVARIVAAPVWDHLYTVVPCRVSVGEP